MRLATGLLCWLVGYIAHGLIYGFDAALTVLIFIALTSLIFQSAEVIDIWPSCWPIIIISALRIPHMMISPAVVLTSMA